MISQTLLDYEILLLLAKHGEKDLVSAIARNLGLSTDEVEKRLQQLRELKPKSRSRNRIDPYKRVESLIGEHPERANYLEALFQRFRNKTFLPELRDVRRFFHEHSAALGHVKSRSAAIVGLFKLLATLDLGELADLSQEPEGMEYSSLGILSKEIMRHTE